MAARKPDAGRNGLPIPCASSASRPKVRAGIRRRHGKLCSTAKRRGYTATRRSNDQQLLQTVQESPKGDSLRIRIFGCGTSTGVPKIGNDWGDCDPNEPRNVRLRTSILVES